MSYPSLVLKKLSLLLSICGFTYVSLAQIYIPMPSLVPNALGDWQTKDVQAVDIDGDDDLDIVLANEFDPNAILINDGNGNFTVGDQGIPLDIIHDSEDIVLADFNGDNLIDIIFISEDDFENEYYWNTGNGHFINSSSALPFTASNAAAAVDITGDGMPDLILGNNDQNMVLVNDGFGNLQVDATRLPLLFEKTNDIKMFDADGDGDLDMFVGNVGTNRLMINVGNGYYADASLARLPQGFNSDTRKVVIGDANGDGHLDVFLCNVEFSSGSDPQDRLFLNNGNGYFNDATDRLPTQNNHTLDAIFIDFDNDGDQDIITANVFGNPMNVLLNTNNQFYNVTAAAINPLSSVEAFGIVAGDFDKDGYPDMYLANAAGKDLVLIRDPNATLVSTKDVLDISDQIKLFPNPIETSFVVDFSTDLSFSSQLDFQVFDAAGKFLLSLYPKQTLGTSYHFDLPENLMNGNYFLQITGKEHQGVLQIFVK